MEITLADVNFIPAWGRPFTQRICPAVEQVDCEAPVLETLGYRLDACLLETLRGTPLEAGLCEFSHPSQLLRFSSFKCSLSLVLMLAMTRK